MINRLPALFIAHGSPMNAILKNSYTESLEKLGKDMERPEAIMVISAHWETKGTFITYDDEQKQIYDFYGFPEELYNIKYNPKGGKAYVDMVLEELKDEDIKRTNEWGLDHGAWGVLTHMYPNADIPVFQLSLNLLSDETYHYNLGKKLCKLREKGILIIGSGNIVHNLRMINYDMYSKPFDWAIEFDKCVAKAIKNKNHKELIEYSQMGMAAKLSVPTKEHYLPLLYIAAMQQENDEIKFIHESIQNGSMSMRTIQIG